VCGESPSFDPFNPSSRFEGRRKMFGFSKERKNFKERKDEWMKRRKVHKPPAETKARARGWG
jgi:hypothetical protein